MRITAFARTDVGRVRDENEDDYFVGEQVFAVADGMGGHVAGEVAAKTALEPLVALDDETFDSAEDAQQALVEALRDANRQVVEKAQAEPELQGMGTTLTAGMLREGRLHLAHVGDSRAYLLRDGDAITQLTTDHTLVERLVRDGRLSRADAATHPQRNVITRAIGNESEVVVDSLPPLYLQPGDQILLCSDGLTGPVADSEIAGLLAGGDDGDETVAELVSRANEAGGQDNITAVLLRVEGEASAPVPDTNVRRIQTRHDGTTGDWANRLGQLGAPQGARSRGQVKGIKQDRHGKGRGKGRGRGRGKRAIAALLAVVLLVGVIAGGGLMLLSRAYFVGSYDGQVAIFRGVPQEVWTVPLYRVIEEEVTDIDVNQFPDWRRDNIDDGITASTLGEARRVVDNLERNIQDPASPDNGNATPDDDAEDADDAEGSSAADP